MTTTTHRTLPKGRTTPVCQHVSFGVRDRMGREVGAQVITWEAEFVTVEPGCQVYYDKPTGRYFAAEVHATRGRTPYGASQWASYHATPEGRDLYVEKYLAGARKRALKKAPASLNTCGLCGERKPADRSCDCFDNHCQ